MASFYQIYPLTIFIEFMAENRSKLKDFQCLQFTKKVVQECIENELVTRASAIAFSAMIASVPFIALIITVAVYLMPDQNIAGTQGFCPTVIGQLEKLSGTVMPDEAANVFESQIARIQNQPRAAVISTGSLITVWLTSSLFMSIIDALNKIYGVKETRPYWKLRLIAASMAIVQSAIVVLTVAALVAWPLVVHLVGWTQNQAAIATFATWSISFLMILLMFAITFQVGPSVKRKEKYVFPGSIFGTVVFLLTTYSFRIYVENFSRYDATYGSLGGVMMLMIWFYITSFVFLFAGQINKALMIRDKKLSKESLQPAD